MLKFEDIEKDLKSYPELYLADQISKGVITYRYQKNWAKTDNPIVLLAKEGSYPLEITVHVDHNLLKLLSGKYETIMPASNMPKKDWATIICSGQMGKDEIFDLIRLSYNLAASETED